LEVDSDAVDTLLALEIGEAGQHIGARTPPEETLAAEPQLRQALQRKRLLVDQVLIHERIALQREMIPFFQESGP
jgi:hypothetical protein